MGAILRRLDDAAALVGLDVDAIRARGLFPSWIGWPGTLSSTKELSLPMAPASTRTPPRIEADAALVARLRLVTMRLARRLRQQSDGDITASMLSALSSIARLGPLTLGELAGVEQVQPPSMTKIVGKLEEQGFVVREPDATDRRVTRVRVSDDGAAYVARSRTLKNAYLAERLERLTPDERDRLADALPLLERLVEDER